MNAPMSEAEKLRLHLAKAFGILGKAYEKFRPEWSSSGYPYRRAFLIMAGWAHQLAWKDAQKSWDEFSLTERGTIQKAVFDLRDRLNRVKA